MTIRKMRHQWALALLLLSLHGVMLWGFDSVLAKTLLLSHYGLFLLWQPIWRGEQPLSAASALLVLAGGAVLLLTLDWWVLAFWQAALFGLLGGRVFSTEEKTPRAGYLIAAAYLLAMLVIWVVPRLLNQVQDNAATTFLVQYLMPLLPLSLLFLPSERRQRTDAPALDFFYSLLLFLLALILVLGSFAIEVSSNTHYPDALMQMLFAIAGILFVMSWLWNPRAGFSGIGQILSRYLLSVGMPFEQWLYRIARLAEVESGPVEFMSAAAAEVALLPWVSGGAWQIPESGGEFGAKGSYSATFDYHELKLTLHARQPLTPVLMLHIKLLTQLLGEFYEAKKREAALREQSYMRAVYETGSRLTHDIKNLVQSLTALCTAAQSTGKEDADRLIGLIQRQLPQLNRRLELTLEKLQSPQTENLRLIKTASWWRAAKQRYATTNVAFASHKVAVDGEIYAEVFDNVLDNLLQNALEKARNEQGLNIAVTLSELDGLYLEVCDDGAPMPKNLAAQLFKSHIHSENGLGIGLYHAARQAQRVGYTLALAENRKGAVRFILRKGSQSELAVGMQPGEEHIDAEESERRHQ